MQLRSTKAGNVTCSTGGRSGKARRWLCLLYVCRQMYWDAQDLVWSENSLFFWDVEPLWRFVTEVRSAHQAAAIRSVALVVDLATSMYAAADTSSLDHLRQATRQRDEQWMTDVASRLSGLKVLCLLVKLPVSRILRSEDKEGNWKRLDWLTSVFKLKILPLKQVRIIVELPKERVETSWGGNIIAQETLIKSHHLTHQDCNAYARDVERALLA